MVMASQNSPRSDIRVVFPPDCVIPNLEVLRFIDPGRNRR
jgi:hypothetical protein